MPICTRLLVCWRSASPPVLRDLRPRREHRFPVAAFPIGCHCWRRLGVAARFELAHQREGHFFLRFGNGTANAQPTLSRYRRAAPKSASRLFFAVPPFSPL